MRRHVDGNEMKEAVEERGLGKELGRSWGRAGDT